MPLISLFASLVLSAQTAPQGAAALDPVVAVAQPIATRAPDDSEWQDVVALDRNYHWTKRATVTAGIVGGGAMLTGAELLVLDVMFGVLTFIGHDGSTNNSPDRMEQTAVFLMGAGAVVEAAAVVGTIVTMVHGNELRDYEHKTGYRVSLTPVLAPRTNGFGALARVEF